jgi:Mg2+-importing ATPase
VEKRAGELTDRQASLEGATNALFMGTSVVSGTARLLVCRTGTATAIGEIAHTLNLDPPPTAFELGTRRFGMLIMRLTVLMVLFVLMVNTLTHKPLLDSFLFAIALAVGLTPELLPMVVSVTLARGALRMAASMLSSNDWRPSRTLARWTSCAPTRPAPSRKRRSASSATSTSGAQTARAFWSLPT